MGKTYHCESTMDNLLDEKINPNQNISILRMNLEMQTKSLLLRDLKKSLGKKMIDIISTPYTEEEQKKVRQVVNKHRDSRIINFSRLVEGEDLRYLLKKFCSTIDEKDAEVNKPSLEAWKTNWEKLSEEERKTAVKDAPLISVLVPVFQCCVQKRRHLLCRTAGDFCRNLHALQAQSDDLFSCVAGCVHAVVPPFVVVFVRPPGQLSVFPPSRRSARQYRRTDAPPGAAL